VNTDVVVCDSLVVSQSGRALELVRSGRCSVLTHTGELAGQVSAGDLPEAMRAPEDAAGGKE
jgi:hypothetical protein